MVKITIAVASLKVASVSIRAASLGAAFERRKTSNTVTASVGAMIAPNNTETDSDGPEIFQRISPPTRVAMTTHVVASSNEGLSTALRSGVCMCIIASKINGDTTIATNNPPCTSCVQNDLICKIVDCRELVREFEPRRVSPEKRSNSYSRNNQDNCVR